MTAPPQPRSSRDEVLALLRRGARTAAELSEAIRISPQAVRDQLRALEAEGFVAVRGLRRDTGGKPAREYRLTAAGEETFRKSYAALLRHLIGAIHERLSPAAERSLLEATARRAALEAAGPALPEAASAADLPEGEIRRRLERAVAVLDGLGGAARVEGPGETWRIASDGCPLSAVVREVPHACGLAEALVQVLSGLEVREVCDRSDRPRCGFELVPGG